MKQYILPSIILILIIIFVLFDHFGGFEKLGKSEYGWIVEDQANFYANSEQFLNTKPEDKARWWYEILSDEERKYYALTEKDPLYNWDELIKIYDKLKKENLSKEQIIEFLTHLASTGEYDLGSKKYEIVGFKVAPRTLLSEKGMKIQKELGCLACHKDKSHMK